MVVLNSRKTTASINYIHMILNLYNQLNRFVTFRNITKQYYAWVRPLIVMKHMHVVTETNLIRYASVIKVVSFTERLVLTDVYE